MYRVARAFPFDDLDRPFLSDVPPDLIKHTAGPKSFEEFQKTAFEVATMFEAATTKHAGKRLTDFDSVLDFGCGAGRLLQFFSPEKQKISGCDVNRPLISFMEKHFPKADIYQNKTEPKLKWAANSFDLVISFSVFSHLTRDSEDRWLTELERVGRPGAIYLITFQGDWCIESKFPIPVQNKLRKAGFHYFDIHTPKGSVMDFPSNYGSSVHTADYVRNEWSRTFDILEVYKGRPPSLYDHENLTSVHRKALANVRSMGQDMVVLRKRLSGTSEP